MTDQPREETTTDDQSSELGDDDLENVAGGVRPMPRPRSSADPQEGGEIA